MTYNVSHVSNNHDANTNYQTNSAAQGNDSSQLHIEFDSKTNRFMMDGKSYTMMEMLFVINSAAATRAKERLAVALQDLQDANDDAKAAVEWLNTLRELTPTPAEGENPETLVYNSSFNGAKQDFEDKYGFDPMEKYGIEDLFHQDNTRYTADQLNKMSEATKAHMSTISDNQQAIGLDTQRYTHRSEEAHQFIASINKSISDVITNIIARSS